MHRARYAISRRMARVFPSVTRRPRVSLLVNPLCSTIHWWMVSTCEWKRYPSERLYMESATHAQRRFVADASHELRAPLTTVQGNLSFLQRHLDELPEEERRTMLADAHGETLRLAVLVEELLLLARADASGDPLSGGAQAAEAAAE